MNDRAVDQPLDPQVQTELLRLRDSIDNMDAALIHLLAERFKVPAGGGAEGQTWAHARGSGP